jgi:CDP-diglyceride synthetase
MMDNLLIIGAILAVMIGAAHSYLGERYILVRLFRRSNLPELFGSDVFTKQTLRFAWHLTTIAWIGLASVIVIGVVVPSSEQLSAILKAISLTFFICAVVTLVASRGRHFSWIVFLSISILVWVGS